MTPIDLHVPTPATPLRPAPALLRAAPVVAAALAVAVLAAPAAAPAAVPGRPSPDAAPAAVARRSSSAAGTFVAALSQRPALNVGIVTDGRRVLAYACGDGRRAVWLEGRFDGRVALLRARRGGSGSIRLRRSGRVLIGIARLGGRAARFRARRARGSAGVWRASIATGDGTIIDAGWVVLGRRRQTGSALSGTSVIAPPALQPGSTVQLGGIELRPIQLDPGLLTGLEVSPGVVTLDPAVRGDQRLLLRRLGLTTAASVEIDGRAAGPPRPSGETDAIVVAVPPTLAAGCHDVTVRQPGQPAITKRDAFRVVIVGAPQTATPPGGFPCPAP
jgi:hypothetical protein